MVERLASAAFVKIADRVREEVSREFVRALPRWYSVMSNGRIDSASDVIDTTNAASAGIDKIIRESVPVIDSIANEVDRFTTDQLKRYGEVIPALKYPSGEKEVANRKELWRAAVILYMTDLFRTSAARTGALILTGISDGKPIAEVEKMIRSRRTSAGEPTIWNKTMAQASRAAEDRVASLSGGMYGDKQQAAGIGGYIWRAVNDKRTRRSHAERSGQPFKWDKPPRGGHPSTEHGCRCWAEPDPETQGAAPVRRRESVAAVTRKLFGGLK
jgi:SPP1 gp7 family putative phage head morphogenesis protein